MTSSRRLATSLSVRVWGEQLWSKQQEDCLFRWAGGRSEVSQLLLTVSAALRPQINHMHCHVLGQCVIAGQFSWSCLCLWDVEHG